MLKVRVVPVLTFNGFGLIKTKQFQQPRMIGNPVQAARVYNSRGVDELVFMDIFASRQQRKLNLKIVSDVIKECFMPVAVGGGIDSIEDIQSLLKIGADKVLLKHIALHNPTFITKAADFFGAQCIAVSVDVYLDEQGTYRVYENEKGPIPLDEFIQLVQERGAGEIVLTSVDHDGMMDGFDIELVKVAEKNCSLPIIVSGGGGNPTHFQELFAQTDCGAVGASSIFNFTQYTPLDIKRALAEIGKPVRV